MGCIAAVQLHKLCYWNFDPVRVWSVEEVGEIGRKGGTKGGREGKGFAP